MRSGPCLGSLATARDPAHPTSRAADVPAGAAPAAPLTATMPPGTALGTALGPGVDPGQSPARLPDLSGLRPRHPARRALIGALALAGLWAALTGGAAESWVMGAPAVLLGAALILLHPAAPRWRLSLFGALRFAAWFALQSVRGATDVARRALARRLPLAPGCRMFRAALPEGAPRLLFANAITLLPGTLTAEIEGDRLVIHMLDTGADLDGDLAALERRVAALFALPVPGAAATGAAT